MGNTWTAIARSLVSGAALRRRQAPVRLAIALAFGLLFLLQRDPGLLWTWLCAYAGAQAFEVWALWPFREERPTPSGGRTLLALASISVIALAWGSMALLIWRLPGMASAAGAVLLLCAGVLNVLSLSRGSASAFAAGAWPYVGLLVALPQSWDGKGREPLAPAFTMAAVTFVAVAVAMWRDADRLRQGERAARRVADARRIEAEAAVEARAAFTAAVSHELRTPLSAILAASGALESRALTSENRAAAALIADGARLMRRLLDDLLDLAKLEAGRMEIEPGPMDLRALVEETLRFWAPEAKERGVELLVVGADALPLAVLGDSLRVRQVLNNLFSNAMKFTAAGEVRLEAQARPAGAGRWRVSLAVADTGPGLDAEVLERLFQPFEQALASTARTHGGTGLGLTISRELARLMDGELTAQDRRDTRGARFVLELSLATAPIATTAEPEVANDARPARVLVIDDHPMGRQALSVLLGLRGYEVRVAGGAKEGLALLAEVPFDVLLTDLHLADGDGAELVARLRLTPGPNQAVPALAVTGESRPEILAAALGLGMSQVVVKPVEPRALYAAVDAALAQGSEARAASRADSAASSFSSHSQTTATRQPPPASASQATASRAVLRAILDSQ